MTRSPEEVVAAWRESAQYWELYRPIIRQMLAPITDAMIESASILEGQRVLDVAGGVGEPALTIAEIVGPRGFIVCTDIASEMVRAAEREARVRNITNISFNQCAADRLPFEDGLFDHTVCRLGAMFFPNPAAALGEMLRITKPEGRVTLAVWSNRQSNPFFSTVTEILSRYVPSPPEPPDAPGAFRFAEKGLLASLLRETGSVDVTERILEFDIEAPISFDEFWTIRSQMSETLRDKLRQISPEQLSDLKSDLRESAREYFPDQKMRFPSEAIIVSGIKPTEDALKRS